MADLSQQLRLQQELNKVLSERQKILESNTQMFSKQAQMAKTLNDSMSGNQLDAMRQKIAGVKTGLDSASDSAKKMAGSTKDMGEAAKDAADDFDTFRRKAIAIGGAIGALKGFRVGIGLVRSALSGAVRLAGSFAKGVFNIGKAIVSIPFKMFSALLDMGGGGGSPVFLQALEKVRETFGDIATGSGLALKKSAFEIRREFTKLTGTADIFRGPTFSRVFGRGREGLAKALEFNAEMATALGGSFASMRKGMEGNFAALAIYRKGLGLSADAMANFMKFQDKAGEDYMKGFKEMSNIAIQVGGAFGFSAKEIGKTLSEMLEDVDNFSQFSVREIGEMAVQTKRLGIEVKDLVGIRQGFDKFSDAVQRTSNMFRFFNMRLDPMDLFKEENPVKRIQMVQKAFKQAGNDVSKMNQRGIEQLAQQNNISVKAAKILFSKKGLEMDYNAVKRQTDKAQKKQLTTAQVLSKLSRQIERVFGGGGGKYKGFFDAFAKGFGRGVRHTRAFRRMMININRSLRVTEMFGRRVGRSFVRNFPGVKQFLGAMADFFNPYKLIPALREISRAFDRFFKALRPGNEKKAFEEFAQSAYDTLDKFFGGKGEALELMRGAMTMIGEIILNLKLIAMEKTASIAAKGITEGTNILAAFLSDNADKSIGEIGQKYGGGIVDTIREKFGANAGNLADTIVNDLLPAIKKAAPVILEGFLFIFSKIGDFLENNREKIIPPLVEATKRLLMLKFEILRRVVMDSGMMGPVFAAMILGPTTLFALAGMAKTAAGIFLGGFAAKLVAKGGRGSFIAKALFGETAAYKRTAEKLAKESAEAAAKAQAKAASAAARKNLQSKGFKAYVAAEQRIRKEATEKAVAKGLESSMKKGGSKFVTKAVQKISTGVGAKYIGTAIGTGIGGPIGAGIGFAIGTAVDAAYVALFVDYKDTAKRTGVSTASAFLAELGSTMTFGLASAEFFLDPFTDGMASSNSVVAEQAAALAAHIENAEKRIKPSIDRIKVKLNEVGIEVAKTGMDIDKASAGATGNTAKALGALKQLQEDAAKKAKDTNDLIHNLGVDQSTVEGVLDHIDRLSKIQSKETFANDLELSLANLSGAQKEEFQNIVQAFADQQGMDLNWTTILNHDMLELHNDFFDSQDKQTEFIKYLRNTYGGKFQQQKDDLQKAAADAQDNIFQGLGDQILKDAYTGFLDVGDTASQKQIQEELTRRFVLREEQRLNAAAQVILRDKIDRGLKGVQIPTTPTGAIEALKNVDPQAYSDLTKGMQEKAQQMADDALGIAGSAAAGAVSTDDQKLDALEAANMTLKRIESLADVPKRLKAAQKKLENVDPDEIADRAGKVFTIAARIGSAIDIELKKNPELTKNNKQTVSRHFDDVMGSATRMANAVNQVLAASRKIPREKHLKTRLQKFKMATTEINSVIREMNTSVGEGNVISPGIHTAIRSLQVITDGLIDSVPTELSQKAKASTTAIRAAATNIEEMKKIVGATDVKATVDLVKAITSGGRLEVVEKDESKPVQVNINLSVDSRRLGRAIVGVKDLKGKYAGKRIATTGD